MVEQRSVCSRHGSLRLAVGGAFQARAGQFVQILCGEPGSANSGGAYLRRPFSLAGVSPHGEGVIIELIYRKVGRGTSWLDGRSSGDHIDLIGPLGNGFSLAARPRTAYLVAGGVGLPPLLMLAAELAARSIERLAFCGARTAELLPLSFDREAPASSGQMPMSGVQEWDRSGTPVIISTDDGSAGFAGSAVEAMEAHFAQYPVHTEELVIFACGPTPMLAAVAATARRWKARCQVAMERMMACGMGTCQSCVVPVLAPGAPDGWEYRLCCKDGPVFGAEEIIW